MEQNPASQHARNTYAGRGGLATCFFVAAQTQNFSYLLIMKMKTVIRIVVGLLVVCIFILITISCTNDKFLTSSDEIEFPKQLTSSGKDFISYYSPNGEYIAFLSTRNTYNPNVAEIIFELWLMKSDGSNQHPIILTNDLHEKWITVNNVSWFNDSNNMLAQIRTPKGNEIWRVTLDGNKTKLSSTDDCAEQPKYSPDGLKIAFLIQGPNPPQGSPVYKLYISNIDFSEPVLVDKGLIQNFEWKSDSNELIYSLYDRPNENYELWKYSISKMAKLQFSNTSVSEEHSSYSSDGKYIAYSVQNTVYVTPSDTFRPKKVLDNARMPKWMPKQNFLLIVSEQTLDNKSFWTESWIVNIEGNVVKKIAKGKPITVNFSSDGKYFGYSVDGNLWVDQLFKLDSNY